MKNRCKFQVDDEFNEKQNKEVENLDENLDRDQIEKMIDFQTDN